MKTHKNYGKVPGYIEKYNRQKEELYIKNMIAQERSRNPPGTRLMPEHERLSTLAELKDSRNMIN